MCIDSRLVTLSQPAMIVFIFFGISQLYRVDLI